VSRVFPDEVKGVTRLDFETIEEIAPSDTRDDTEALLRAEIAELKEQLRHQAEALPGKLEEAKRLARLLARKDSEREMEERTAEDRSMVLRACEEFAKERTRYFAAVESQVVKLALAIAARVLQREARMDPLLLAGAVRVALEKVDEESETRLRVPMNEAELWSEEFEAAGDGAVRVVGDEGMARGECVLETSVGTVDLGVEAQLGEIERGFFDLMQRRPA
jgi:flagellar assembly protein FliH